MQTTETTASSPSSAARRGPTQTTETTASDPSKDVRRGHTLMFTVATG